MEEEREVNYHERLEKKLSELEEEWTAMNTSKSSQPAVSWITEEEAIKFVENSPRELMLSLQDNHQPCPEAEKKKIQIISPPFRRKLFQDSDDCDEIKPVSFSHSSCWSSSEMRVRDNGGKRKKEKKKSVFVGMVLVLLSVWVVLMNEFDHFFMDTHIDTLVPT